MVKRHFVLMSFLALAVVGFMSFMYLQSDYITGSEAATVNPLEMSVYTNRQYRISCSGVISAVLSDDKKRLTGECLTVLTATPTIVIPTATPTKAPTPTVVASLPTATTMPAMTGMPSVQGESMAMAAWGPGSKNIPNPQYDKCTDGTNIVTAHNKFYVIAYDGIKYPTWHPAVVVNPVTGNGKCYFGHEHGSDPQKYLHWDEVYNNFGKDLNGDGKISPMIINATTGAITSEGDHAGIPFGIANQHMDQYYAQEDRDSIFVRHEDHVGHKIEYVNYESDLKTEVDGNTTDSTHQMTQPPGTQGLVIPYYLSGTNTFKSTGVVCAHLHKFHQGTNSADAVRNNLHEVIFHSECQSVDVNGINAPAYYPNNTVMLTGMMSFGNPGGYKQFCGVKRDELICPDGYDSKTKCTVTDPLISKLPNALYSNTLGRNMVDRSCLESLPKTKEMATGDNPFNFNPYEIWQGDFRISTATGKMLAEHGRQWDVLDPVRFVDPTSPSGIGYFEDQCTPGGLIYGRTNDCNQGETVVPPWNSPQSKFRGLHRTTYFGRNRVSNAGGSKVWWTDPLGGNATTTPFSSGLKQQFSSVEADIQKIQSRVQQLYGTQNFLNDRAIQRKFNEKNEGNASIHAPN